jgi:hypothetical protein
MAHHETPDTDQWVVDMLDPDKDDTRSVEAAAVRPTLRVDLAMSADEEAARDAALRERHPQPPLTTAQLGRIAAHRGSYPSPGEIAGMNSARARGIHTSIV